MEAHTSILIAPDKWKGSLTAFDVCRVLEQTARQFYPAAKIQTLPLADGGDGFAWVTKHYLHTETITTRAEDAIGRQVEASYEWDAADNTAYIELAAVCGLASLKTSERNPQYTHTRGAGLLAKHALDKGARKIVLGLGGSASIDGGTGLLSGLGYRFFDKNSKALPPGGGSLKQIASWQSPQELPEAKWLLVADVNNPLAGKNGAAEVYGPQKGADAEWVQKLDAGLQHWSALCHQYNGKNYSDMPGAGAAGGTAMGVLPFFPAKMMHGWDWLTEISGLEDALQKAELILTGEGKADVQSFMGKPVGKLIEHCRNLEKKCIVFCGVYDEAGVPDEMINGVKIFSLKNIFGNKEDLLPNAEKYLQAAAQQAFTNS